MTVIDERFTAKGFTPASQAPDRDIRFIVIHHWGAFGQTHDGVVDFFCNTGPGQTSAHYVASAGRLSCIVSDSDVAWHAGSWDANLHSIGIECRPEATDADYATVAELVRVLRARYGDLPLRPHRDFYTTACPGKWDLTRLDKLARAGAVTEESGMSAADADRVINYVKALAYGGWGDSNGVRHTGFMWVIEENKKAIAALNAQNIALRAVIDQLAAKQGVAIDYAKIDAIVDKSIEDAKLLKQGDVIEVNIKNGSATPPQV